MGDTFHARRAFTLVEVLLATTITGLLVTGMIFSATQLRRLYKAQADVSDLQQNARAALDMIARDIRMAGYGVVANDRTLPQWVTWVPGITGKVTVVNGAGSAPDRLSIVGAIETEDVRMNYGTARGATSFYVESGKGPLFNTTDRRLIYIGKAEMARVTMVSGDRISVSRSATNEVGLRYAYPAGTRIEPVKVITYAVTNGTGASAGLRFLMRNENISDTATPESQIVSTGIEDLQVSATSNAVNVEIISRASAPDDRYRHPVAGDRYRRASLATTLITRNRM
jgi:type IV pilus assembly protein PilW